MKRVVVSLAILIPFIVFFPSGLDIASITFTCNVCGEVNTVTRYELCSPDWLPIRYPGINRPKRKQPTRLVTPCKKHPNQVAIELYTRKRWSLARTTGSKGTANPSLGNTCFVNEYDATLKNAPDILNSLMKRQLFVIGAR